MKKAATRQGKPVPFQKLHGAGNDILVVESKDLLQPKPALMRRMAHRQTGLGCDQIMEVISRKPLKIQVWNGDGTKAEMCGNGARALLFLAAREGWIKPAAKEVPIQISGKAYTALKVKSGYELALGVPVVEAKESLSLDGVAIPFTAVNVGNPHCVIFTGEGEWTLPADYSLRSYGSRLEVHARFPKKTNVEFIRSWSRKGKVVEAMVDVWERGAGATLSCGSGAVAVAAALRQRTGVERFAVRMTDYTLHVRFEGDRAFLSGPAAFVAKGFFYY